MLSPLSHTCTRHTVHSFKRCTFLWAIWFFSPFLNIISLLTCYSFFLSLPFSHLFAWLLAYWQHYVFLLLCQLHPLLFFLHRREGKAEGVCGGGKAAGRKRTLWKVHSGSCWTGGSLHSFDILHLWLCLSHSHSHDVFTCLITSPTSSTSLSAC